MFDFFELTPSPSCSSAAIPSRNSFTQQMRRNGLKNRKISQTHRWRREKHQRSLQSTQLPLGSDVVLRELCIRVRRHPLDFLLHCKDPKSQERALLLQLEDLLTSQPRKTASKPLTVITRRANSTRNSLKATNAGGDAQPEQEAKSRDTETAVCLPAPGEITSQHQETAGSEVGVSSKPSNMEPGAMVRAPDPVKNEIVDRSKATAESPFRSLQQYLTVSLIRLSVPHLVQITSTTAERRRSSRTCSSKGALTQVASTKACSTEGGGGVREMLFKPLDRANPKRRHADSEAPGSSTQSEQNGKVIAIQAPVQDHLSGEPEKKRSRERKEPNSEYLISDKPDKGPDRLMDKEVVEEVEEEKREGELEEQKREGELEAQKREGELEARQDQAAAPPPEHTSINTPPARRLEEDIVIKQAKVLLSDILRTDDSFRDKRLLGGLVGRSLRCSASGERPRAGGGETQAEDTKASRHRCLLQRKIARQRAAVTETITAEKEKSSSQQSPAESDMPLPDATHSPPPPTLPLRPSSSPTTCGNSLPQDSPISIVKATGALQQPDCNLQALTQSNIPLKKRTFRNSAEADGEQAQIPVPKEDLAEVNPGSEFQQGDTGTASPQDDGMVAKKAGRKKRVRKTELQRLGPKKVMTFNQRLRLRNGKSQCSRLIRRARKCKSSKRDGNNTHEADGGRRCRLSAEKQISSPARVQGNCVKIQPCKGRPLDVSESANQQDELKETKPDINLKILFRRRKGRVWEMKSAGREDVDLKLKNGKPLVSSCDPFKAIMESVSVLNMEMEAAQAHVQASKKSKNRLLRLKRRGEKLYKRQPGSDDGGEVKADQDNQKTPGVAGAESNLERRSPVNVKLPEPAPLPPPPKMDKTTPDIGHQPKVEDRFQSSCCLYERDKHQRPESESSDGSSLPVIRLRRKKEDIWEVDGNKGLLGQKELKLECDIKAEAKGQVSGKQQRGRCLGGSRLRDECQRSSGPVYPFKAESPPFCLSLSPLSLSSPLNDDRAQVPPLMTDPGGSGGGRKQRHKTERVPKFGPAETPTTCLSHTLQQIDNSLSKLSEGLCSSQTLEKSSSFPSTSNSLGLLPPSQSPPFTVADGILSGEPSFTNCYNDDILDFPCFNFDGYYQPQTMLPSSPSDLCSLDPPTDPFSSPLSHSPSDTWATETPYLGPPSPATDFTSDELQFFPGLISSKSDPVLQECVIKDPPKDGIPPGPTLSFSALATGDPNRKERVISKNAGMRPREDVRTQPQPVINKPRLFSTAAPISPQCPVSEAPRPPTTMFNVRASTSQSRVQSSLKTCGPFHRMVIPNRASSFGANSGKGMSQNCLTRSLPVTHMNNRFLSPQLFSAKNPSPPDNPFKAQTSTVIHRVLKFQGGNPSPGLYSAPCKDSKTFGMGDTHEKIQQAHKLSVGGEQHLKGNSCISGFGKTNDHLPPTNKTNFCFPQSVGGGKLSSDKHDDPNNMMYRNFSTLPRSFFPGRNCDNNPSLQEKTFRHDRVASDKHQPCYPQQDPFDFSFGSSLSPISQDNSPQLGHATPPGTPAPRNKTQSSSTASCPYGYQGPPYVLNFTGDHSLTLGLRDGSEGCPGLGSTNYTYHCLMEPSGTQGRLVLEPCGPQLPNSASFSLGLRGQDDSCRKEMPQQFQPSEHSGPQHYGPTGSHSLGTNKPKRVRLVVTDGTVDLDLQYSD